MSTTHSRDSLLITFPSISIHLLFYDEEKLEALFSRNDTKSDDRRTRGNCHWDALNLLFIVPIQSQDLAKVTKASQNRCDFGDYSDGGNMPGILVDRHVNQEFFFGEC